MKSFKPMIMVIDIVFGLHTVCFCLLLYKCLGSLTSCLKPPEDFRQLVQSVGFLEFISLCRLEPNIRIDKRLILVYKSIACALVKPDGIWVRSFLHMGFSRKAYDFPFSGIRLFLGLAESCIISFRISFAFTKRNPSIREGFKR